MKNNKYTRIEANKLKQIVKQDKRTGEELLRDWYAKRNNLSQCNQCKNITEELFLHEGKELCETCIEWKYNQ